MRVLVAMDKFKGSLTARAAVEAVRRGLKRVKPEWTVETLPLADGGDGTMEVLAEALGGEWRKTPTVDALGRTIEAEWLWFPHGETGAWALLEMSVANGLRQLQEKERDPLRSTTEGTGRLMLAAKQAGVAKIVMGIGGSATNDGGSGMARALGYRFLDTEDRVIADLPEGLGKLARLDVSCATELPPVEVLCDVSNPLLGANGATAVYGPQKGVTPDLAAVLESALHRMADVAAERFGEDRRDEPGAGAAGGLGFGLMTFAGARLRGGFDWIAERLDLETKLKWADLVITGEGSLDVQSTQGKVTGELLLRTKSLGKPIVALAGRVEGNPGFESCRALSELEPDVKKCIQNADALLERLAADWAA